MNPKQAKAFVRKMRLSPNTILLVKKGTEIANHLVIENLGKAIEEAKISGVIILVVDDVNGDIAALDKSVLNKNGWYRSDDFAAVMRSIRNDKTKPAPTV